MTNVDSIDVDEAGIVGGSQEEPRPYRVAEVSLPIFLKATSSIITSLNPRSLIRVAL